MVVTSDLLVEHVQLVLGIQGKHKDQWFLFVENNLQKCDIFLDGIKSTKSRGVSADWMVCGVELRDVDSWSCLHSLKLT